MKMTPPLAVAPIAQERRRMTCDGTRCPCPMFLPRPLPLLLLPLPEDYFFGVRQYTLRLSMRCIFSSMPCSARNSSTALAQLTKEW